MVFRLISTRRTDFFNALERYSAIRNDRDRDHGNAAAMSDTGHQAYSGNGPRENMPVPTTSVVVNGEIVRLVEQISSMYLDEECSDVTLVVEGTEFPAHRVILAARSVYFRAMFFGGMRESKDTHVELHETPVHAFRLLLKYIYTGTIQLNHIKIDLVFDILGLVHKYGFTELEQTMSDYLKSTCNVENVCPILTESHFYSLDSLTAFCLDFMDAHADVVIKQSNFRHLSVTALDDVIKRDSFCAPEIEIFKAVTRWMDVNPDKSAQFPALVYHIRLSLIKLDDLLNVIRPSGLIQADVLLDAINDQTRMKSSDLVYRGFQYPNVNVATLKHGASVVAGDATPFFFSESGTAERGSIKHTISEKDSGIIIELGRPFILNFIRMHLLDRDQRAFSYYIEVSVDRVDWVRVIDYTKYLCRSRQNLYFNKRVVRFIRICGTATIVSSSFQITAFEAYYTTDAFDVDPATTLSIPRHNVATIPNNALVIEGVSRSRNALLNGDTKNYDWDNGYTCHQLGSGNITVQLPQPYLIDSFGLLLWDCDDRRYSYTIEVSVDQTNWTQVVEECDVASWRKVAIPLQPVVFIKIVGTQNSANEVFHCVHFECPAVCEMIRGSSASTISIPSGSAAGRQFAGLGEQPLVVDGNALEQGIEQLNL
uniref:BTB domain-containing protein n=1 Tax=Panagrellus redivivus TaxID=6233 RepID=A0A7E4VVC7_PANRE